jgi:hypothetical protein
MPAWKDVETKVPDLVRAYIKPDWCQWADSPSVATVRWD